MAKPTNPICHCCGRDVTQFPMLLWWDSATLPGRIVCGYCHSWMAAHHDAARMYRYRNYGGPGMLRRQLVGV